MHRGFSGACWEEAEAWAGGDLALLSFENLQLLVKGFPGNPEDPPLPKSNAQIIPLTPHNMVDICVSKNWDLFELPFKILPNG